MLEEIIKNIIKSSGSISVTKFMQLATQHPQYGYYNNVQNIGKYGDFITAPEVSPIFGEIIAIWIMLQWHKIGCPTKWALLELGPGKGTLLKDIYRSISQDKKCLNSLSKIYLLESSISLKKIQKTNLAHIDNMEWIASLNINCDIPIIAIANEFFDALPISQFIKTTNGYEELMICYDKKQGFYYNHNDIQSNIIEKPVIAAKYMDRLLELLNKTRGACLIIDYGYLEKQIESCRSTLQAIINHKSCSIFENIGLADLSAHVNFTYLQSHAEEHNFRATIQTQQAFLLEHGIMERSMAIIKRNHQLESKLQQQLHKLLSPSQMGTLFKALIVEK